MLCGLYDISYYFFHRVKLLYLHICYIYHLFNIFVSFESESKYLKICTVNIKYQSAMSFQNWQINDWSVLTTLISFHDIYWNKENVPSFVKRFSICFLFQFVNIFLLKCSIPLLLLWLYFCKDQWSRVWDRIWCCLIKHILVHVLKV